LESSISAVTPEKLIGGSSSAMLVIEAQMGCVAPSTVSSTLPPSLSWLRYSLGCEPDDEVAIVEARDQDAALGDVAFLLPDDGDGAVDRGGWSAFLICSSICRRTRADFAADRRRHLPARFVEPRLCADVRVATGIRDCRDALGLRGDGGGGVAGPRRPAVTVLWASKAAGLEVSGVEPGDTGLL
jgi:hypothetical protein